MNLLAYLRVSTSNQVGEDKFGFDSQMTEIEKYCQENGHTIVATIKEQISGAKDERPLFNQVLYGETDYEYDGIIVAKIDRLSRSIENYFGFKYILKKQNKELLSANENEEFSKLGIFSTVYEALITTFAELERQRINERMSGGRNVKAKSGGYSGGKAPYGYMASEGSLIINEQEKENLLLIYDLRGKGYSMQKIADTLTSENRLTRNGKAWQKSTIKSILSNEDFYKGIYEYGSNGKVEGKYERIL